ncbi:peptide synthetase, partial [Streptomyces californicus]
MPGAQCHAVRVAVTGTDVRRLRDRLAAAGPWRLWTDDIPGAATGPIAVRRRASELRRPVRGDVRGGVRYVLLRYGDGTADLVVVAHRDRLDGPGLHHLVAVLTGERPPSPAPHPAAPRAGLPPVAAAPDWGGGDPSSTAHATCHVDLPLPHATAPAALRLPALAVTLARYDGHGATAAATVGTDDRGAREYALPASATLRDLAGAEPAHTAQGVVAGILDAGPGPLADERLPCLAPPFPLTFVFSPLPDGATRLSCHFRLSHAAPAVAEGFTRHLAQVYRQAVLAPDTAVADVELLDRDERDRVARLGRPAAGPARTPEREASAVAQHVDHPAV